MPLSAMGHAEGDNKRDLRTRKICLSSETIHNIDVKHKIVNNVYSNHSEELFLFHRTYMYEQMAWKS